MGSPVSERALALRLIREAEAAVGAELGVWRGARAFAILDETPVHELLLVDPWEESRNRFQTTEPVPLRMTPLQYHCTMGERHQSQTELDMMAQAVQTRARAYGDRVRILRLPATDAARRVTDASLDFVLWDAVHLATFVAADLEAWGPKVRPGGLLMGDGFGDPAVREGVLTYCNGRRWCTAQGDFWHVQT